MYPLKVFKIFLLIIVRMRAQISRNSPFSWLRSVLIPKNQAFWHQEYLAGKLTIRQQSTDPKATAL